VPRVPNQPAPDFGRQVGSPWLDCRVVKWVLSLIFLAAVLGQPGHVYPVVEEASEVVTAEISAPDAGSPLPGDVADEEPSPDELGSAVPYLSPLRASDDTGDPWRSMDAPASRDGGVPVPPPIA